MRPIKRFANRLGELAARKRQESLEASARLARRRLTARQLQTLAMQLRDFAERLELFEPQPLVEEIRESLRAWADRAEAQWKSDHAAHSKQ